MGHNIDKYKFNYTDIFSYLQAFLVIMAFFYVDEYFLILFDAVFSQILRRMSSGWLFLTLLAKVLTFVSITEESFFSFSNQLKSIKPMDGCDKEDDQEHLVMNCDVVKLNNFEVLTNTEVKYEDVFSENVDKIKKAVGIVEKSIRTRESLLN